MPARGTAVEVSEDDAVLTVFKSVCGRFSELDKNLDVRMSKPEHADTLCLQRLKALFKRAASEEGVNIRRFAFVPEPHAAIRDQLTAVGSILPRNGKAIMEVHDGGGGTTHYQMARVNIQEGSIIDYQLIWTPPALSIGGETICDDIRAAIEAFVDDAESDDAAQFRAEQMEELVQHVILKPEAEKLPFDPTASFRSAFASNLNELLKEDTLSHFWRLKINKCDDIMCYLLNNGRLGREQLKAQGISYEEERVAFISIGGMARCWDLVQKLRIQIGDRYRTDIPSPHLIVAHGLVRYNPANHHGAYRAKKSWGILTRVRASKDGHGAEWDEHLQRYDKLGVAFLINKGDDLYNGREIRHPLEFYDDPDRTDKIRLDPIPVCNYLDPSGQEADGKPVYTFKFVRPFDPKFEDYHTSHVHEKEIAGLKYACLRIVLQFSVFNDHLYARLTT